MHVVYLLKVVMYTETLEDILRIIMELDILSKNVIYTYVIAKSDR